jgi:hypothetical protein
VRLFLLSWLKAMPSLWKISSRALLWRLRSMDVVRLLEYWVARWVWMWAAWAFDAAAYAVAYVAVMVPSSSLLALADLRWAMRVASAVLDSL